MIDNYKLVFGDLKNQLVKITEIMASDGYTTVPQQKAVISKLVTGLDEKLRTS